MKLPFLTQMKITQLRKHLLARRFAVPKLQRNFVWDSGRAAKLLDSIYQGMPIGSLFLWEMDQKSANLIRQAAEVLPSFDSSNKQIWFVIDGQQRLSVIHQAFEAQVRQNDSGRDIDFSRLFFVVSPDKDQENPPRIVYRKPAGGQFIPVRDIMSPEWRNRMPSQGKIFLKKIKDCRDRLLKYALPVVIVQSATLDEIGEVFIRINAQGMRITSADRAIALMGELDVRAMAQEIRQKIRDQVFELDSIDPILRGFNLVTDEPELDGDPPKLESMARRWSKRIQNNDDERDRFKKLWHKYQHAFLASVDYLHHRFPVYDESYLPSGNMLATLAVFFYYHPGQPNPHQATEIRKWFWATGLAERYSGKGYHRNIVADTKWFRSLANGTKKQFSFTDLLDPVHDIQSSEYASRSARTRTFFCLLASQKPLYLESGEQIPLGQNVTSHANRKARHHVFPQAQLRKHLPSSAYNSLCNICFLVSRDNEKIGQKLPRNYLTEYRDAGRHQFSRVMRSHLIPVSNESGVWEHGVVKAFKQFKLNRLRLICSAFEKAAGLKLFRKY